MDMLHPEVENVICYILVKNLNLIGILSANHIILQFLITIFFFVMFMNTEWDFVIIF